MATTIIWTRRHAPLPLQSRLPLMIGGGGERHTLRTVALTPISGTSSAPRRWWHANAAILDHHCAAIGRDPAEIEQTVTIKLVIRDTDSEARRIWADQVAANGMWLDDYADVLLGPPELIAEALRRYREYGFSTVIADAPAPYDEETIERLATEVPSCWQKRHGP